MKVIMKRSALGFAIMLLSVLTASAGNPNRIASAGAQELLIPVGARGIALGSSALATMSGAEAIYYNPAGLARSNADVDVMFSTMNHIADINVSYAAVAMKAGSLGSLGLSIKSLGFGDVPVTSELFPDGTGETYSPSFFNLGLTYSNLVSDRVSFGVTAQLVSEKIMSTSASGMAFTVGIQYDGLVLPGLSIGVAIRNVGTQMKFEGSNLTQQGTINGAARNANPNWYTVSTSGFDLPTSMEIGLGYKQKMGQDNVLTVSGLFENNNFSDDEYKVGGEFSFQHMLFVRGGYSLSPQANKDVTGASSYIYGYSAGVGIAYELGNVEARLDYAYRYVKYFNGNNVITIALGF